MRHSVKLSVVLVTYNHRDYIEKALDSVLEQITPYAYEIVVIDDASDDGTSEIVQSYAKIHPKLIRHYRSKKNVGNGRLATFALRPIIRGKYWCILEGDDFWTFRFKIFCQVFFLDTHPSHIGVTSTYKILDEKTGLEEEHIAALTDWTIDEMVSGKYALYCHTSTWVWRNIFSQINSDGFHLHEDLKEPYTFGDTCLSYYMANQGGNIYCFDTPMTCYRMTGKGAWTKMTEEEQNEANVDVYNRINKITGYKYSQNFSDRIERLRASAS